MKLFIRKPNKLYLSETGKYTAREAKKLINDNLDFTKKVKQFDRKVIGDYLIPFVVSLVTTLLTLAALYAR